MSLELPHKMNGSPNAGPVPSLPEHMARIPGQVSHFTLDAREVMCIAPTGLNECTIMFRSGGGIKVPANITQVEKTLWGNTNAASSNSK